MMTNQLPPLPALLLMSIRGCCDQPLTALKRKTQTCLSGVKGESEPKSVGGGDLVLDCHVISECMCGSRLIPYICEPLLSLSLSLSFKCFPLIASLSEICHPHVNYTLNFLHVQLYAPCYSPGPGPVYHTHSSLSKRLITQSTV